MTRSTGILVAVRLYREARWQHPSARDANLIAAPSLKAPMHSFVVRVALRQHVPLRADVEYPQHRFEHTTGRNRFAPRTSIGNFLLRKMIPDALPLLVREPKSFDIVIRSTAVGNFEIGSNHQVPRRAYARAFEALLARESEKQACRAMVALLAIAHDRACELELVQAIDAGLDAGVLPDLNRLRAVQARSGGDPGRRCWRAGGKRGSGSTANAMGGFPAHQISHIRR